MRKYAVQLKGRDFEPQGAWQVDPTAAVLTLQTSADYDLLVWDPDQDTCDIYPQHALATLNERLGNTAYSRLLAQMAQVTAQQQLPISAQLKRQWYLVGDLATLEHYSLMNVAAALLSLTIQSVKNQHAKNNAPADLRGLANQARCWLLAAKVSALQLVASPKPLTTLLQYLLAQDTQLDACYNGGRSKAWQLASDAAILSATPMQVDRLQSATAWTLIRAAALEHYEN